MKMYDLNVKCVCSFFLPQLVALFWKAVDPFEWWSTCRNRTKGKGLGVMS